ncbi:LysR substrate-binding domain-containing protein [uncultured Nisaea sp.]|uniref:LysR family transcriptional regulator n=1 Tax=uncultured Nisaea sp. TaxID=538215 RepID=UPI0030EBF690|tara:strand:- start:475 stop:1401 length:927 start_codon:yes stop_codon:yes gene_type:complete
MDLRQLRTFLHVAELGSLSHAAERLHIAQPALGRQIRLLEEDLGVALFTRHGRGMALTSAGRILTDRASAILRLVEDTRAEVSAEQDAVKGAVCLGVPPTIGEVIAGRMAERFLRDYPEVTLRIVPAFSGYLLDMIQRGEADLAVMYETGATSHIRTEPLIEETLYLIGPPSSDLDITSPVPFPDLADLSMILPGSRHGLRNLLENAAGREGIALRVSVEADALQTLKELVARGLGYTVLPLAAVHADITAGTLRAAPIARPALTRKMVLTRSIVRPDTNAVRIFASTLKAETADMVSHGIWQGTLLF